jgi:hypothetical protein
MNKPHWQSNYAFWQFCEHARCTPSSPDISLSLIHKKFYKHPQRHELRAQWVVDRAMKVAGVRLHLESVIEASKREEQELQKADKHTIGSIKIN